MFLRPNSRDARSEFSYNAFYHFQSAGFSGRKGVPSRRGTDTRETRAKHQHVISPGNGTGEAARFL